MWFVLLGIDVSVINCVPTPSERVIAPYFNNMIINNTIIATIAVVVRNTERTENCNIDFRFV